MCVYQDIEKANDAIKPTDIGRDKQYAEVPQRVKAFRMVHPNGSIVTELVSLENGICIFKATVSDEDGKVLGTGTAYEKEGSSFINKTSYIENCETSAVGRALGFLGFGIDVSIASKEEVENAKLNQQEKPAPKKPVKVADAKVMVNAQQMGQIELEMIRTGITEKTLLQHYKVKALTELTFEQANDAIENFKVTPDKKAQ